MYVKFARFLALRPRRVLAFWILVVIATALSAVTGFGDPLWNRLISDVPQATPSESHTGQVMVESHQTAAYSVMAYVSGVDLRAELEQAPKLASKLDEMQAQAENQGDEAKKLGDEAKAAGDPAQTLADQARALGEKATELGNRATSLGNQAKALGREAQEAGAKAQELKAQAEAAGAKAQQLAASGDMAGAGAAKAQAEQLGAAAQQAGAQAQEQGAAAQQFGAEAQAAGTEAQTEAARAQEIGAQAQAAGEQALASGNQAQSLAAQARRLGDQAKAKGDRAQELGDQAKDKGDIAKDLANRAQALGDAAQALGDQAKALSEPDWPVSKALHTELKQFETKLKGMPHVDKVSYPFVEYNAMLDPQARELVAKDGQGFVIVATMDLRVNGKAQKTPPEQFEPDVRNVEKALGELGPTLKSALPKDAVQSDFRVRVTDADLVNDAGIHTLKNDLVRSESIGIPLSFLIMAVVFGGFLAALLPLSGAMVAISTALAIMLGMTYLFEQQSFAVNVISVLGLGLSIDYGLLIVSRYHEELVRLRDLPEDEWKPDFSGVKNPKTRERLEALNPRYLRALEITLSTAGRTTFFSALTVAIASSGMIFFRPELLKSLGIAGSSTVLLAMIAALTLVSALMFMASARLEKPSILTKIPFLRRFMGNVEPAHVKHQVAQSKDPDGTPEVDPETENTFFYRISIAVTRKPWLSFIVSATVLVAACLPLATLNLRNSLFDMLPVHNEQRLLYEELSAQVPRTGLPPVRIVAEDTTPEELDAWTEANLSDIKGIAQVFAASQLGDTKDSVAIVDLETKDIGSPQAERIVKEIRDKPHDFERYVIGQAANQIDFISSLAQGLPWVLSVLVIITIILLFLMTGSIVIPLQALVINTLSLMATLGISTLVFVDGFGVELLGAQKLPGLESYVVVMLMCFGFGLSMDYELFLLSRMKEVWDETGSARLSVIQGLTRSARIVTSAATILVFVFLAFVTGHMIVLKQVGFILALAVAFDATIVRMVLVPSVMALFGRVNWWAPRPLRRLHNRFSESFTHHG
ncbi:MMPL family transporter [uncultured Mobiluncus sp.]|uniref:MMPL family transporter n=1 Tax=uncultured Mobiluncus sp. TaxID=293425 RepID=UPI00260B86CD|nr:MMPL family transporter [uncultured Mobiluncus sp.]